jgi:ubiquinone/menaquinone biosynthesis C-methylase UbiE
MLSKLYYGLHRFLSGNEERGEYSAGLWQNMIRAEALKSIAGSGVKLLEVGCGEGLFLAQASAVNPEWKLWGVDNSGERIERAKKRLFAKNAYLLVGDAANLSFYDGYFDVAVCVNVFFNMPSIDIVKKTLEQMKRVVRNDGRLIFDFRNSQNTLLALKYKLAPYYDRTVRDLPLMTYSMAQMSKILKELGLEIVEKKIIGAIALFPAPIILIEARKI